MIHSPGGVFRAASSTSRTISSQLRALRRSNSMRVCPKLVKWPCPSMKPGIASFPVKSITLVLSPISLAMALARPTATIRPSRAANASTSGLRSSSVTIFPPFRTRSAGDSSADACKPERRTVAQAAAAIAKKYFIADSEDSACPAFREKRLDESSDSFVLDRQVRVNKWLESGEWLVRVASQKRRQRAGSPQCPEPLDGGWRVEQETEENTGELGCISA